MGKRKGVFTIMNENDNEVAINNILDMGINMFPIYQKCIHRSLPPEFNELYSEYTAKIIEKDNDLTPEYIRSQIQLLQGKIYTPQELNIPNFTVRPEPEVINFLLTYHYCFKLGNEYLNVPIVGVW